MRRCALLSILAVMTSCGWMDERKVPVDRSLPSNTNETERDVPDDTPPLPTNLPVPSHKPAEIAMRGGLDPKQLIGLGFRDVEALLGEPVWRGERPPAKMWIYSAQDCVLNIFFYADINTKEFRSLTYEIKGALPTDEEEELTIQCLAQLKRGS